MAKRPAAALVGGESSALPASKRVSLSAMPPLDIGPACGEEDLSVKVLQVSWGVDIFTATTPTPIS